MLRTIFIVFFLLTALLQVNSQVTPSVGVNDRYTAAGTIIVTADAAATGGWTYLTINTTYPAVVAGATTRTGLLCL